MKQIVIVCAAVLLSGALHAQKLKETEVPQVVKVSFAKNFPKVKSVKWSKESESQIEAEFKNGSLKQSANFDTSGNWLETETEIKKSDLPLAIQGTIKNEFDGFKVEEAEKVETPEGVFYEVELEKGEVAYDVQFSKEGNVLKKEEEKEDEDEEKDGK